MARVAFQGEFGAFSEEAVRRFFGAEAEPAPQREFADVGRTVVEGGCEFGVLPVENTLAGSVVGAYDVLAAEPLRVVGEVVVPIHHCVLGLPGASLPGLRRVISHPVALAQCGRWMRAQPSLEAVAVYDTAGAAKEVAERQDASLAAIAARTAARRYGLALLAENVEDRPDNQTRFLVVTSAQRPGVPPAGGRPGAGAGMRTTLLLETQNVPGALLRVLAPFAERGINLCKLESRPTGEPWTYRFFLELDADEQAAAEALREVEARAAWSRVLGTYPRWGGEGEAGGALGPTR